MRELPPTFASVIPVRAGLTDPTVGKID